MIGSWEGSSEGKGVGRDRSWCDGLLRRSERSRGIDLIRRRVAVAVGLADGRQRLQAGRAKSGLSCVGVKGRARGAR